MNRKEVIVKNRSSLWLAASAAVIFTVLSILSLIYSELTSGIRGFAFWLFLISALIGFAMICDYSKAKIIISDEGIIDGTELIPFEKVKMVGMRKSFIFVYGEKNKVLASIDADLSKYETALKILEDHGVEVADVSPLGKKSN